MRTQKRLLELINREIIWASDEMKSIPDYNDGSEKQYYQGYILAMNKAKQIIKKEDK